jgi:integrase
LPPTRTGRRHQDRDRGCRTFRATGITAYLENGGTLEHAQQIAAHESPRTTKLYDRTSDQISLKEIEPDSDLIGYFFSDRR